MNTSIPFILDVRDTSSIPAQMPSLKTSYSLAVIGDKPNAAAFDARAPFGGAVAQTLWGILQSFGVPRQTCYASNLSESSTLSDLESLRPNLVLLHGATALNTFLSGKNKITDWRGSVFSADQFLPGQKCLAIFDINDVFRDYSQMPLLRFDLRRAAVESTSPTIAHPRREFQLEVDAATAVLLLQQLQPLVLTALDIEGGVDGLRCISFTQDPATGFIIPWDSYTLDEQCLVAPELARVLKDPCIPKVLQNSLYDNFVLSHVFKMPIRGVFHDTMLSGWELYPELPKALAVQASIWTREPFYKMGRTATDLRVLWDYCCRDSAVTLEIAHAHRKAMSDIAKRHYQFNISLLAPLLYMELRGINYDAVNAALQHAGTLAEQHVIQGRIDTLVRAKCPTHTTLNLNSPKQSCHVLYDILNYPTQHPKDGRTLDRSRRTADVDALLNLAKLSPDDPLVGDILAWRHLDRLRTTLAATPDPDGRIRCGYNVVGTETGRLTCYKTPTGTGANLQTITKKLRYLFRADPGHYFFQCDLAGADGWTVAAHCLRLGDSTMFDDYLAGIKPAKVIALMFHQGLSVNSWSRDHLKEASRSVTEDGPDGWLYFACKRVQHGTNYGLGKDRMALQILNDSHKKMGRAIVVSPRDCLSLQRLYLARYGGVTVWQRWVKDQLEATGQLGCASGHIRTFFGRRNSHSTYMEALAHEPQANTTYATNLAMHRLWTAPDNRRNPESRPTVSRNGQENRPHDHCNDPPHDGGAVPQGHTDQLQTADPRDPPRGTTAKNLLIVEPLHQVHDALCGQFPIDRTDWARQAIRSWFDNPLVIAGQQITIPFAGQYGPSWGDLPHEI